MWGDSYTTAKSSWDSTPVLQRLLSLGYNAYYDGDGNLRVQDGSGNNMGGGDSASSLQDWINKTTAFNSQNWFNQQGIIPLGAQYWEGGNNGPLDQSSQNAYEQAVVGKYGFPSVDAYLQNTTGAGHYENDPTLGPVWVPDNRNSQSWNRNYVAKLNQSVMDPITKFADSGGLVYGAAAGIGALAGGAAAAGGAGSGGGGGTMGVSVEAAGGGSAATGAGMDLTGLYSDLPSWAGGIDPSFLGDAYNPITNVSGYGGGLVGSPLTTDFMGNPLPGYSYNLGNSGTGMVANQGSNLPRLPNMSGGGLPSNPTQSMGQSLIGTAAATLPSAAVTNWAMNQKPDTAPLYNALNMANPTAAANAAIAPARQSQATAYGDLLQSDTLRGLGGSPLMTTDISNFLGNTNAQIGNIWNSAYQGAVGNYGNIAAQIPLAQSRNLASIAPILGGGLAGIGSGLSGASGQALSQNLSNWFPSLFGTGSQ